MFFDVIPIVDPITQLLTNGAEIDFGLKVLIRILLAVLFASMLGVERASKRHAAGFRTFMLVTLGSTLGMLVDIYLMNNFGVVFPAVTLATVVGTAIITSNTILYSSKNQIKGLTTSVALWCSAFLGLALGAGLYVAAITCFIIIIIAISILPVLEIYLKNRSNYFEIHLELKNKTDLSQFVVVIRNLGLKIDDIEANPAYMNSGLSVYTISLSIISKELKKYKTHAEIIDALKSIEYVSFIEELS